MVGIHTVRMLPLCLMIRSKSAACIRSGAAAFLFFAFAVTAPSSASSGTPTTPAAQERANIAQHFVGRTLNLWQGRLGFNEWDIHVNLVRSTALEPRTLGNSHWDTNLKHDTIDVLSPYDYTLSTPEMLKDMEVTVVHELVHLELATLPRSDATKGEEEQAVVRITSALLNLSNK
jgi:hypothetical protein